MSEANLDEKEKKKKNSWNKIWRKAEIVCSFLSIATIVFLFIQIVLSLTGIMLPNWFSRIFPIFLSAAVGYGTNYFAIEMLFKPYNKTDWHYFAFLTLGLWRQGLVPSKKNEIAEELGKEIESKLLNPEEIANEICSMVGDSLKNPNIMDNLQKTIQMELEIYEPQIVDFMYPQLELSLVSSLNDLMTKEKFEKFFIEKIDPYLRRDDVRQFLANRITQFGRQRSAEIIGMIKGQCRDFICDYLSKNPITMMFAKNLSDGLVNSVQWDTVEWKFYDWVKSEKTQHMIRDEILKFLNQLQEQWHTPEMQKNIELLLTTLKSELKPTLQHYLHDTFPAILKKIIESDTLWIWIRNNFLPQVQPKIENWIRANGKILIIDKLNIASRVRNAVDKQDIKQFHGMINQLAAEHLGAIQVLGYVLGAIVGLLQLLI